MLRLIVSLMVILSLCIVHSVIGHPGVGYGISPEAEVGWAPPTSGHGDGTVSSDTKISFTLVRITLMTSIQPQDMELSHYNSKPFSIKGTAQL